MLTLTSQSMMCVPELLHSCIITSAILTSHMPSTSGIMPPAGVKMFSRPGPLLVESLECLVELLHSEAQHYGHAGKLWQQVQLQGSS